MICGVSPFAYKPIASDPWRTASISVSGSGLTSTLGNTSNGVTVTGQAITASLNSIRYSAWGVITPPSNNDWTPIHG